MPLKNNTLPLSGLRALVTSGPTHEPLDPVRFLGNRSSGRQGHAVARALAQAGAAVTLVSGPVSIAAPEGVSVVRVVTARQMLAACRAALPVEIAVCAAAVADWRPLHASRKKLKKKGAAPVIALTENPDILRTLSRSRTARPALVVGFAAETENLAENARAKRLAKGCDWMIANDVSGGAGFDAEENRVLFITRAGAEEWPLLPKAEVADRLVSHVIKHFKEKR